MRPTASALSSALSLGDVLFPLARQVVAALEAEALEGRVLLGGLLWVAVLRARAWRVVEFVGVVG